MLPKVESAQHAMYCNLLQTMAAEAVEDGMDMEAAVEAAGEEADVIEVNTALEWILEASHAALQMKSGGNSHQKSFRNSTMPVQRQKLTVQENAMLQQ
jgi:hypothetical protein